MESKVSKNKGGRKTGSGGLHDSAGIITQLTDLISSDWNYLHDYIITPFGTRAYCLRFKDLVSDEEPRLATLREHHRLALSGVYGHNPGRNDRLIGYCLMYSGSPFIHHHPQYCSYSYSEIHDIMQKQPRVIFDDDNTRLIRFGVGTFDYLWLCRERTEQQIQVDMPDHIAHEQFRGSWQDGM